MSVNLQKIVFDLRSRVIELEKSVATIGKVMMDATKKVNTSKKEDEK